ncbi:TonB-dependent receptor [Vibrio sp. T187]|nr:TonB-dependent receptor [Vibrio sp. T187]
MTCCSSASLQAHDATVDLLMSMSLEELSMLDIEMNTATKTTQKLTDIPSSVYVLSNERIQRSGVRTLAEALMLVPGLKVTKFSETEWFVSTRGFHDGLYNKMLVMMDGRSLFSPVYGGTYWTNVDYILADIERIEVLKGPGGAIWGGNTVNGVINIITKSAKDTQGTYVSGLTSGSDNFELSVRHGVHLNEDIYGRAYYKHKQEPRFNNSGSTVWSNESAGVVIENEQHNWVLRFGGLRTSYHQDWGTFVYDTNGVATDYVEDNFDIESQSTYVQFNSRLDIDENTTLAYSFWAENAEDNAPDAPGNYTTVDLDSTVNHRINDKHQLVVGGGIRYMALDFSSSQMNDIDLHQMEWYRRAYDIKEANDVIVNTYVQSQYQWTEQFSTTLGVKVEYFEQNSSLELSPQARAMYQLDDHHSFWTGVSRSVVSPSYMDSNSTYFSTHYSDDWGYFYTTTLGSDSLGNESVITGEVGYRLASGIGYELDATVFISKYYNARSIEGGAYSSESPYMWESTIDDNYSVKTQGVEVGSHYLISETITGYLSYAYLESEGTQEENPNNLSSDSQLYGIDQEHVGTIQLMWNVTDSIQLDILGKYHNVTYSDMASYEAVYGDIDPNLAFDARVAWKKNESAPLFEMIVENIGQHDGNQTDWSTSKSSNEESVYVRVSHEF